MVGKKQKHEDEILSKELRIRFSEKHVEQLKIKAANVGIPLSPYIRKSALKSVWNVTSATDIQAVAQIRKIGVNINQMTKRINQYKENDLHVGMLEELRIMKNELMMLHKIIKSH